MIKHAETKAGFTLAASGATGGVIYTLIRSAERPSTVFAIAAATCAFLVVGAACFGGLALLPRRRANPEPISLLYYHHIATRYHARPDAYVGELGALVKDADALVAAISEQVWANAQVARQKYRWSGLGIKALLASLAALGITASIAVLQSA
ncbi:Pycsar system effector family protein [Nonomuraea sp. NPDC050022]